LVNNSVSGKKYDAVIVGSGPNGFAAALTLAKSGRSVLMLEANKSPGGGMRSADLMHSGCIHDICSSVHPLGIASPFFSSLGLEKYGLEWINPPAALAHPLDDGTAILLERSIDATITKLGADGHAYRKLMSPLVRNWDKLLPDILAPLHFPEHPLAYSRFGFTAAQSAVYVIFRNFHTRQARALFAGMAAHSKMPLDKAGTAAFGLLFGAAGHAAGWPVAKGGSQQIAAALQKCLISLGGEVKTGVEVHSLDELPEAKTVLLDITPRQLAKIGGNKLPDNYRRRLAQHKYGPGVFKMDWVLNGPVPWKAADCLKATTVHVGGTFEDIAGAENEVGEGQHPEYPFVLVGQSSLFDPTRAPAGMQTVWAYCHVPNGSTFDMSERIEAQIERFAPGFRGRVKSRSLMNTAALEIDNANYVGGDIAGGVMSPFSLLFKPMGSRKAYATPLKGVYVCSSSMPPGAGVHGMCGYHAAKLAIKERF
jgi:phytoene dehydrogenase-like protein